MLFSPDSALSTDLAAAFLKEGTSPIVGGSWLSSPIAPYSSGWMTVLGSSGQQKEQIVQIKENFIR